MHSSHYHSFTIHYDGDYSGEYIIVEIRRDGQGNQLLPKGNFAENKSSYDYPEVRIDSKKFDFMCKKMIKEKSFNTKKTFDFNLKDNTTKIIINSGEMVDFYTCKMRDQEICKLEEMGFKQLLKRYSK